MNKIGWLLLNTLTFAGTLYANYYVTANAPEGKNVGEISDMYPTLITPAGYAFAIWGIIYLALLLFIGFQWFQYFRGKGDHLKEIGIWFAISNAANALWIYSWLGLMFETSVIVMFLLLLSLIQLVVRLRLEIWDAPVRIIVFVWWPVVIYFGWIVLASAVNVAAWLVSTGWAGGIFSETTWAVIILLVATLIYLAMIRLRNLREAAMVGVWGISAIAVARWDTEPALAWWCVACAVVLFLAASYHGFINRATSPLMKMKRGEI